MKQGYKILAVIPARGGSKGVPRKNIKRLAGKPLLAWTVETALSLDCLDRVILSTDDEEIAGIGKRYGADVPFLRPAEIAADDTTDMPVYEHALNWLEQHDGFIPDIVVWLRPTVPLRSAGDIENSLDLLIKKRPDWVRSVCEAEHHPYWMYKLNDTRMEPFVEGIRIENYMRRQLLPPAYRLNGAVDVTWRSTILEKKILYAGVIEAHIMPVNRSIDIDTMLDFQLLEAIISQGEYE
ncbi:acylneuraminate cytidylyltransferase family protein [Desulfobacter postgatei]|uniref:acylneuraminate cytidylyltransferase family protein n=1 Tax=Desulfobacter postgatei TaxID=2293 RepID=UPI00259B7154|nr:acylneuraminate cytidylyltransferase family protein [uncultured Desulfobacter sp.]